MNKILIPQATKKGYIEVNDGGVFDASFPTSKTRRGRVLEGGNICGTITCNCDGLRRVEYDLNMKYMENNNSKEMRYRIRKLTPRECFRLMGVDDSDIDKIQAAEISNSQQYKLAGNSIVVDVLYQIFRKMFCEPENENDQLTLF